MQLPSFRPVKAIRLYSSHSHLTKNIFNTLWRTACPTFVVQKNGMFGNKEWGLWAILNYLYWMVIEINCDTCHRCAHASVASSLRLNHRTAPASAEISISVFLQQIPMACLGCRKQQQLIFVYSLLAYSKYANIKALQSLFFLSPVLVSIPVPLYLCGPIFYPYCTSRVWAYPEFKKFKDERELWCYKMLMFLHRHQLRLLL